jgi:plasmid stability protein
MASITVRKLDDNVKKGLRRRAAEHGRSLEAEVREILGHSVNQPRQTPPPETGLDLVRPLREFVEKYGGVELPVPPRAPLRDLPFQEFQEEQATFRRTEDEPRKPRRRRK